MKEVLTQRILKKWFEKKAFKTYENVKINSENKVDLIAKKQDKEWVIEVKGDYDSRTEQYSVNFDTGMGQILKSITRLNEHINYAICIPFSRTERSEKLSYRLILKKYSKSIIFELLNIYIILVRDDESIELIHPRNVSSFLNAIDPTIRAR